MRKLSIVFLVLFAAAGVARAQGSQGMRGTYWLSLTKLGSNPCGASQYCLYMRSSDGHLIYSNSGSTTDLSAGGGAGTLSTVYAAGAGQSDSTMTLDSTRLGVRILDAGTSINTLFTVANNAASTNYFQLTTNAQQLIKGAMADGASAVGLGIDTTTTWANATSKPLRVLTGGSERFSVTGAGNLNLVANASIVGASSATNTTALTLSPNVADGASSIAWLLNNTTTLSNATAELMDVQNNGTSKYRLLVSSAQYSGSLKVGGLGAPTYQLVVGPDVGGSASNVVATFSKGAATSASIFVGPGSSFGEYGWDNANSRVYFITSASNQAICFGQGGNGNANCTLFLDANGAISNLSAAVAGTVGTSSNIYSQVWQRQNIGVSTAPAFSATVAVNCTNGELVHIGSVNANVTGATMTSGSGANEHCTVVWAKDATANAYTITWSGSNVRAVSAEAMSTTASSLFVQKFVWDDRLGTAAWVEESAKQTP